VEGVFGVVNLSARRWIALALVLLVCLGVGALGSLATTRSIGDWYATLRKPPWNPPNWIFAPVWTALYASMAVAAWMVWLRAGPRAAWGALGLFVVQLVLNLGWSWLFFGLRNPGAAVLEIALLWVSILVTLLAFRRISPAAGWLMVPYLGWVSFAAALNFTIWRLNA
jgi:tryptophan-rich sensory protein